MIYYGNDLSRTFKPNVKHRSVLSSVCQLFLAFLLLILLTVAVAIPFLIKTEGAIVETTVTPSTTTTMMTTTTAHPYPCGNMTILISRNFATGNIGISTGLSWANCCALCLGNASCGSLTWTVSGGNCYLKPPTVSNGTNNTFCISAKYS